MAQQDKPSKPKNSGNLAGSGNASNPSPGEQSAHGTEEHEKKQAEKYLREAGNIEDYPDATDMDEAEKMMKEKDDTKFPPGSSADS